MSPWPEAGDESEAGALERVQELAQMFRRSGVLPALEGDELRIFTAVVKPERAKANGNAEAERERLRKEIERAEKQLANERFVQNAPDARRRRRAREARAVPPRARCNRRLTGSRRSARGRRTASAPGAWPSCSHGSATRSARSGRCTSSGRRASRRPHGGSPRRSAASPYTSPHVSGWHERLQTDPAGFERAVARVRPDAEAVGATQFEAVTAAAFADFAARGVESAAIEAGLGGRHDATNVIDAPVVLLTNVALEHTDVLGATRAEIAAREAGGRPAAARRSCCRTTSSRRSSPGTDVRIGGAREAAEAFLGRRVEALAEASLPGRLELRGGGEVWDGAHTPEAVDWLLERLPEPGGYVVVASILGDKDADGMLERLARAGRDPRRDELLQRPLAERGRGRGAGATVVRDGRGRRPARGTRCSARASSGRASSSPARSTSLPT